MAAKEKEAEASTEPKEGEAVDAEAAGKVKGKRKLLIIIGAVVLLLAIGAGVMLSGVLGGGEKKAKEEAKAAEAKKVAVANKPAYYELPKFLVNLSTGTGRTSFLNMTITLELRNAEAKAIMDANQPRVLDTLNTYLRELRPSDLSGSAGIYRLKEELIRRLNATIEKGIVKDILFNDIIIQ